MFIHAWILRMLNLKLGDLYCGRNNLLPAKTATSNASVVAAPAVNGLLYMFFFYFLFPGLMSIPSDSSQQTHTSCSYQHSPSGTISTPNSLTNNQSNSHPNNHSGSSGQVPLSHPAQAQAHPGHGSPHAQHLPQHGGPHNQHSQHSQHSQHPQHAAHSQHGQHPAHGQHPQQHAPHPSQHTQHSQHPSQHGQQHQSLSHQPHPTQQQMACNTGKNPAPAAVIRQDDITAHPVHHTDVFKKQKRLNRVFYK